MISEIIKLAQLKDFKGAGEYTEIAKGKNELGNEFQKIKRRWLKRL
jgi:hypothetical protein